MKIFKILIVFILFQISSATESISTAISDVILKFHPKYSRKLEIILYGENSQHLKDILDEVQRKLKKIPKILRNIEDTNQWNHQLKDSSLILIKSVENLKIFNRKALLDNLTPNPDLKFFIYCESATYTSIQTVAAQIFLGHSSAHISEFEYFIINDNKYNQIAVQTFQYFSKKNCNHPKIINVGYFDKIKQKWIKLSKIDKYKNLFNCELTIGIPPNYENSIFYKRLDPLNNKIIPMGIQEDLIKILSQINNFRYSYKKLNIGQTPNDFAKIVAHMETDEPFVIFSLKSMDHMGRFEIQITSVFFSTKTVFLITPGELYTPYEKLLLPFDFDTWMLLIFTFTSALSIIFIMNRLTKTIQQIVFGKKVQTPSLNVIGTFFGIGQLREPDNNFGRLLLINFLLFCLVIRNAYQGVMFEMMTKEMRRPEAQTFENLWENNFDVYYDVEMYNHTITGIDGWKKFNLKYMSFYDMQSFYENNHDNSKIKAALLVPIDWKTFIQVKGLTLWPTLKQEVKTLQVGFVFFRNNYFMYLVENVLQRLIDAGILQHSYTYHEEILYKFIFPDEPGPKILSLYDLSHGFIVWLVTCGVAVIVFFGEILVFLVCKKRMIQEEKVEEKNDDEEDFSNCISLSTSESSISSIDSDLRKFKFAKIHPIMDENQSYLTNLENIKPKIELIENFKVKKMKKSSN
ncbi:hypothetical protein PVAND_016318 [Polypedilum vanderplanki]|uniref:Ionotropic receptor n=1 Tax=Polypedilum vanderplanki TaxID=319348 RepID=A0A9J6BF93_POLVA|nr:hypothetical protein PVAND_016318 [Polypedilum vanderplanki]